MQLQATCPKTTVDGFDAEIVLLKPCLFAGRLFETLFIDHYVRLTTVNDGSNSKYPVPTSLTLLITQYVEPCKIEITLPDTDPQVGIVILEHYQSLTGVRVVEIKQPGGTAVGLIIWIKDERNNSTHTQVYVVAAETASSIH